MNKLSKMFLVMIIILAIVLGITAYYYSYYRRAYFTAVNELIHMNAEGRYPDTFYATIEEISDTTLSGVKEIKVKGLDINDINHREEYYFHVILDNIPNNFKIKWNKSDINFEQLQVGQTVAIYNYGNISDDEPNFLNGVKMIIVINEEL